MTPREHIAWVSIAQFDPFLRVGALHSFLGRLHFLQTQGCRVSILDFLAADAGHDAFDDAVVKSGGGRLVQDGDSCRTLFRNVNYSHRVLPVGREQLPCAVQRVARAVRCCLEQEGVGYVWTADQGYSALLAARQLRIPGAHFFHTLGNVEDFAGNPAYVWLLQKQTVIANSQFMQAQIKARLGLESVVWHSFVDLAAYRCQRDGARKHRIGFYSVHGIKGRAIVHEIAALMPERAFLVVGPYAEWPSGVPTGNVTCWGYVADMRRFYNEIDLLLVPSVVEEAFGRVILEAAVNGIPVIANRVGGIPDALGESGILIDWDQTRGLDVAGTAQKYVAAIRHVLDEDAVYDEYRRKALDRAEAYERELTRQGREIIDRHIRPSLMLVTNSAKPP